MTTEQEQTFDALRGLAESPNSPMSETEKYQLHRLSAKRPESDAFLALFLHDMRVKYFDPPKPMVHE